MSRAVADSCRVTATSSRCWFRSPCRC